MNMPNLIPIPGSTLTPKIRPYVKEEHQRPSLTERIKETGLDDIAESPTSSRAGEVPTPTNEDQQDSYDENQIFFIRTGRPKVQPPKMECTSESQVHLIDDIDGSPTGQTRKMGDALRSPKAYFFENIQKRRENRSITKSHSTSKFMSGPPNLLRRKTTSGDNAEEQLVFEDRFTSIDMVNAEEKAAKMADNNGAIHKVFWPILSVLE
jgi:hypothetical protein